MSGNHNSGRRPKYLTVERFEKFLGNDFKHLNADVKLHRKLLLIILGVVIVLPTVFMIAIVQILGN